MHLEGRNKNLLYMEKMQLYGKYISLCYTTTLTTQEKIHTYLGEMLVIHILQLVIHTITVCRSKFSVKENVWPGEIYQLTNHISLVHIACLMRIYSTCKVSSL